MISIAWDDTLNPIALRRAKPIWSFGCSECSRVKGKNSFSLVLREKYFLSCKGTNSGSRSKL